jgi:plastocyanin
MTTTLEPATVARDTIGSEDGHGDGRRTATWRQALVLAASGQLLLVGFMLVVALVFEGRFDPTPIVIGAVIALGVVLLRSRRGRGGVVYAGVVSLLLFAMVALFGGLTVFTRAESTVELILFGGLLVVSLLGLAAAAGAWPRSGRRAAAAWWAPRVAGGVVVALVVVGVVAGVLSGTATRMSGDLALRAEHFEFTTAELSADAGRVAVFVQNDDVAHHDFTIKGVVRIDLPGQKAGRAAFDVDPGTYRFSCSVHPAMEGTLKVS